MNFNKTVVTNGKISQVNVADLLDITDPKQVKQFNELRKQNFKKSFNCGIGVKSFGLGNIIDALTTYTGIKKIIKLIFKECGCEKRRKYFNKWSMYLPYVYFKLNLKSNFKDIEVVPQTEIYLGESNDVQEVPIPRSMVKKSNSGCGCNKRKG